MIIFWNGLLKLKTDKLICDSYTSLNIIRLNKNLYDSLCFIFDTAKWDKKTSVGIKKFWHSFHRYLCYLLLSLACTIPNVNQSLDYFCFPEVFTSANNNLRPHNNSFTHFQTSAHLLKIAFFFVFVFRIK